MTSAVQTTDPLSSYAFDPQAAGAKKTEMDQDAFMTLMLEQLKNQDPLQPSENGEFLAQMAQFSTVSGIDGLQKSIDAMASNMGNYQILQSASLVGRSVLVPTNEFTLTEDNTIEGVYDTEYSSGNAIASIYSTNGELLQTIDLGVQPAGQHEFSWDGMTADGERAEPGTYSVTVSYGYGEEVAAADLQIQQKIDSVNFSTNDGQIVLNTEDGLSLNFSDITQIH